MGGLARVVLFLVVGIGLGYFTADYSMEQGLTHVSVRNGAWTIWPAAGSPDADPYTRAHFSATGQMPLTIFEAATFRADTDDEGVPLDQDCEYRIEGRGFESRWWSIAAYKSNRTLIDNEAGRHSFNSQNLIYDSQGEFNIALSREARSGNWLPLATSDEFYLSLTLFNPEPELRNHLEETILPRIVKVRCT